MLRRLVLKFAVFIRGGGGGGGGIGEILLPTQKREFGM